jgi:hypothetical protein
MRILKCVGMLWCGLLLGSLTTVRHGAAQSTVGGSATPITTATATAAPACNECEMQKAIRDVKLGLENARHEVVEAELQRIITALKSYYEALTEQQAGLDARACELFENPYAPGYLAKVGKNLATVVMDGFATATGGVGVVTVKSAGLAMCKKVSTNATKVVVKIGSWEFIRRESLQAGLQKFTGYLKTNALLLSATTYKKHYDLESNAPNPALLERMSVYAPVVGSAYQLGAHMSSPWSGVGGAVGSQESADVCLRKASFVMDELVKLTQEKNEEHYLHLKNIDSIHGEAQLWTIPGCCRQIPSNARNNQGMRPLWHDYDCGP